MINFAWDLNSTIKYIVSIYYILTGLNPPGLYDIICSKMHLSVQFSFKFWVETGWEELERNEMEKKVEMGKQYVNQGLTIKEDAVGGDCSYSFAIDCEC